MLIPIRKNPKFTLKITCMERLSVIRGENEKKNDIFVQEKLERIRMRVKLYDTKILSQRWQNPWSHLLI